MHATSDRRPTMGSTPLPADFWLQDLRLGRYEELLRRIDDPDYRAQRIAAWFKTRRVLTYLARQLGVSPDGTNAQLQVRLGGTGAALLPYLGVAAFAPRKVNAAVIDAAEAVLSRADLDASRDDQGDYDLLLLLLRMWNTRPEALAFVRGLHAWHRHGEAALVLAGRPAHRRSDFLGFLTRDQVERAIAGVPLPRGVPRVRFEMAIPRPGGDVILLLSRNMRRAHHWSDDGLRLAHGHDEELIILHFLDQARRVSVSDRTTDLPRHLAEAIATAWFAEECSYVDDLAPAEPASLRRMLAALVTRQVPGLHLVELAVQNAPLSGTPELVLRTPAPQGDITEAILHFEQSMGPLLDRLDDVLHLKVTFAGRRVEIDFPMVDERPVARFADGRFDRHSAKAFRDLVEREFGLPIHSMEARCA